MWLRRFMHLSNASNARLPFNEGGSQVPFRAFQLSQVRRVVEVHFSTCFELDSFNKVESFVRIKRFGPLPRFSSRLLACLSKSEC